MIKYPKGISKTSVLSPIKRDRILPYSKVLDVSGMQPAAGDIIALMNPQQDTSEAFMQITRLEVHVDSAVMANDTDLVVFGQETGTVIMNLHDGSNAEATWNSVENEDDTADGGAQLKHRVFEEAVQIGLRFTTAHAAAIAANKQVSIVCEYVKRAQTDATETKSVAA